MCVLTPNELNAGPGWIIICMNTVTPSVALLVTNVAGNINSRQYVTKTRYRFQM